MCKEKPIGDKMRKEIETAIHALESYKSDDLARAKAVFKYHTQEQLDMLYGASGSTPRKILAKYQEKENEINAAIEYLKGL